MNDAVFSRDEINKMTVNQLKSLLKYVKVEVSYKDKKEDLLKKVYNYFYPQPPTEHEEFIRRMRLEDEEGLSQFSVRVRRNLERVLFGEQ